MRQAERSVGYTLIYVIIGLCLHTNPLCSQSNWQLGVAIGISYSDFLEEQVSITDEENIQFNGLPESSFQIWNQYNFSNNVGLTISPGFSWRGARLTSDRDKYEGVYFMIPVSIQAKLNKLISFGAGLEYSYLISFGESSNEEVYNLTDEVSQRHLIAAITNVGISVNHNLSVNLEYNHGLNSFYQLSKFNRRGGFNDIVNVRNQSLKLSLIFHN